MRPIAIAAALLAVSALPANAERLGLGSYTCETQRLVGIWHDEDENVQTGAVEDAEKTFTMTVAEEDEDRFGGCVSITNFVEDMREWCNEADFPLYVATFDGWDRALFTTMHGSAEWMPTARLFMWNGISNMTLRDMPEGIRYILKFSTPNFTETGFFMDDYIEHGLCQPVAE